MAPQRDLEARRGRGYWENSRRTLRYRLVIPLFRSRKPPEHTARGVLFGLLVALTPTVGFQMAIVAGIWALVRAVRPAWDFNVVVGMAWTWITNVFTVPPIYYTFLVTGRLMLGETGDVLGYGAFAERLEATLDADAGWLEALWVYTIELFNAFGVPMFLGSLPWAIVGAWLGYVWSLKVVRSRRSRRLGRATPKI